MRHGLKNIRATLAMTILALALAACGGGGGGGDGTSLSSGDRSLTSPATGAVTLSWIMPTTRVDGAALSPSEIAGYKLYYGTASNALTSTIRINDPTQTEYTIQSLPSGTYYFKISAIDADGLEGPQSVAISRSV